MPLNKKIRMDLEKEMNQNHILLHLLWLIGTVRRFAFKIMEIIQKKYFQKKFFWTKLAGSDYIQMYPVRAKIVLVASDYLYSSASNYVGKKNIFDGFELMSYPIVDPAKNDWTKDIDNW